MSSLSHKSSGICCLNMPHDDHNDQSSRSDGSCLKSCWLFIGCCLLLVAIFAIPFIVVAIFIILIYIAALPVLILSFLVTRALQLLWHGDEYDRAVQLKLFIRSVMFLVTSLLATVLAIFYGISKLIPSFKQAVILETPLEDWMKLIFLIYGIYMLHWVLSVCVFRFVPNIPLDRYQSGFNAPENVLEIIDCLIILLAVSQVEKRVPLFKADKILGLCTRKWVEVTILVFLAYNVIVLLTRVIIANEVLVTKSLKLFGIKGLPLPGTVIKESQYNKTMQKIMRIRYVKSCAVGLKHSIDFILCSIVFLLTWEFYFRSHLEETPQAERVLEVGTISCVTLLVCAILWFIKTKLLVIWEVRAVCVRLENKIVEGAKQLYFLGILGSRKHDIFKIRNDEAEGQEGGYIRVCLSLFPGVWDDQKDSAAKLNIVRGDLVIKKGTSLSFYGLQQMAYYFLQARETLKDDKYTHRIIEDLKEWIKAFRQVTEEELNKLTEDLLRIRQSKVTKEELNKLTEDLLRKLKKQEEDLKERIKALRQQDSDNSKKEELNKLTEDLLRKLKKQEEDLKERIKALRQQDSDNSKVTEEELNKLTEDLLRIRQQDSDNSKVTKEELNELTEDLLRKLKKQEEDLKERIKALRQQDSDNSKVTKEELYKLTKNLLPKQQEKEADNKDGQSQKKKEGDKIDYWKCFDEHMSEYVDSSSAEKQVCYSAYSLKQIEEWMEKARHNCLFLANTLSSAKELVRCLNNIISWLVIAATFILWLLLTGFATTQVLVLFVSPLVAASFIFGDTCKTLFQGIIFVYVVHPFHVGDFCIIDEHMMEVRTIGIWITTFSKVDTQEEVIYPNSTLFTKEITNYKSNLYFDWSDHIEFEVGSVKIKTKKLKKNVKDYFKTRETFVDSSVMVSRAENVTKIAVTYKSNKDMKNSTYSQCLEKKQKLKSKLLVVLQDRVERMIKENQHIRSQ